MTLTEAPARAPVPPAPAWGPNRLAAWLVPRRPARLQSAERVRSEGVIGSGPLWGLTAIGALAIWLLIYGFALGAVQEDRAQGRLYAQLREGLSAGTIASGGAIPPGSPVALLASSRGVLRDLVVVEGTDSRDLRAGPGHRRDSALPGQPGVSLLYGRSVTFGHPFARLTRLREGDTLTVTTSQGVFSYRVDRVRRPGTPLPPALTSGASRLTLTTSEGTGLRAGWAPDRVVSIDSTLTGQAQAAPPGRPTSVPATERLFATGDVGLVVIVFWLQALLAASLALAYVSVRWGSMQSWLVGLPCLLAVLWGLTSSAAGLLPNLV